jgi:hypothetical protein
MEEMFEIKCIQAQIAEAICECAAQVNESENPVATDLLLKTMDALLYSINPPRGDVVEVTPDQKGKRKT